MKLPVLIENIFYWNRKFHIHAGLFLLLFILLFFLSGLFLNHNQLKVVSFWKERKESEIIIPVIIPVNPDTAALPKYFMKQLKLSGEIRNIKSTAVGINFRVIKPGKIEDILVDYKSAMSVRKELVLNWWGKINNLHTFNGSDKLNPQVSPNWIITRLWRLTMDITAIGLILLCISSWIMWYKIRESYPYGLIILISGISGTIFFVFLLRVF
jgi:hypothetical protein